MKTSSNLFRSNLKHIFRARKMEKYSSNSNNMSEDSLEENFKKKNSLTDSLSDDNVETVAVPFYEKEVLVKVPTHVKATGEKKKPKSKPSKDNKVSSYLVNRHNQEKRSSSYLEKFRKQFLPNYVENKRIEPEISSLAPEVGDTDRGNWSFEYEEQSNPVEEFHNTEAYNEIYYENLLQREVANYSDNSLDEEICVDDDLENKSPEDNLRSVSEVSQPRRQTRRVTLEPNVDVKLGGLGPDMELIRPQQIRARSLQRYSDKVRQANRVSIYKKSVNENREINIECELKSARKSGQNTPKPKVEEKVSYLVNTSSEKIVKEVRKCQVTKSAIQNKANGGLTTEGGPSKSRPRSQKIVDTLRRRIKTPLDGGHRGVVKRTGNDAVEVRVKSGAKGIQTEIKPKNNEVPPIHISFLVNVENSSGYALKNLEEKHRRYQEMVKQYVSDYS